MFDIGFWELTIIAIIALLVVGPDRLPEFARTAGRWVGRVRHFLGTVKRDLDRELQADELKRMIKPAEFEEIHEIMEETRDAVDDAATAAERIPGKIAAPDSTPPAAAPKPAAPRPGQGEGPTGKPQAPADTAAPAPPPP